MADRLYWLQRLLDEANGGRPDVTNEDFRYLLEVADAARAVVEREPTDGDGYCRVCFAEWNLKLELRHRPDCPWLRLRGLVEPGADPGADRGHQVQITAPPRNT